MRISTALLLLFSPACFAQSGPSEPLSVEAACRRAMAHRPEIGAIQAQLGVARARLKQARSGLLPSVVLQGAATDGPSGAPGFGPIQNPALLGSAPIGIEGLAADPLKKNYGAGLTITQTLVDSGRTRHLTEARTHLVEVADSDAAVQNAAIVLSVQEAYYGVLRAQALLAVREQDVRQRESTLKQAKAFVEGQLRSGIDGQNAAANLADAESALVAAKGEVQMAFANLNNAMGETSLTEFSLTPDADSAAVTIASANEAMDLAARQRPETWSAHRQRLAADQLMQGAASDGRPRLDAIASFGAVNPSASIRNSKNYAVGILLSVPIASGGFTEGRMAEEREHAAAAISQERAVREAVRLQAARAWVDLQTQVERAKSAEAQVSAAETSLRLATERYHLQLSSIVELSESETLAIQARTRLAEARYAVLLARAHLAWATGATADRYAMKQEGKPK